MTNAGETEGSQVLGQFIPLHYHHNMLNDRPRIASFKAAIEALVPLGGKVLELGGGTGVLSFFAAQRAARVWCVERDPELVRESRRILSLNQGAHRIEVIEADAFEYLPPEPVDVVISEMLHVGLLREKQVQVIHSFKSRYREKFGPNLPVFIPEASILGVQPVQQSYDFQGFYAPVPLFQQADAFQEATRELAPPVAYQTVDYSSDLPPLCSWSGRFTIASSGTLNAMRFTTKNILAIIPAEQRTVDWFCQYLVMPLEAPLAVGVGQSVSVAFTYRPGAPLSDLAGSLYVERA